MGGRGLLIPVVLGGLVGGGLALGSLLLGVEEGLLLLLLLLGGLARLLAEARKGFAGRIAVGLGASGAEEVVRLFA